MTAGRHTPNRRSRSRWLTAWIILLKLVLLLLLASCSSAGKNHPSANNAGSLPQAQRMGNAGSPQQAEPHGPDASGHQLPSEQMQGERGRSSDWGALGSNPRSLQPEPSKRDSAAPARPDDTSAFIGPPFAPSAKSMPHTNSPGEQRESQLTFAAVGDVLIHRTIYQDARTSDGQRFDFRPMFAKVQPWLQEADITFANQESIVGGQSLGLSDYPAFNSPLEVAEALRDAGVDIVSMANNHVLDRGEKAIRASIAEWSKLGIEYVGAYASDEDRARPRIMERNGIKLAFLAYTYDTNGIQTPEGKSYLVRRIDRAVIASDIVAARTQADAVVVSLHFGKEYERTPNAEQTSLAKLCAASGADIVIGHHPHVLQPIQWIDNSRGGKTLVAYSLGNFLAAQKSKDPYNRIGGILQVVVKKTVHNGDSRIVLGPVRFRPTYIRFTDWRGYRVIPLGQATARDMPEPSRVLSLIRSHMRSRMPELSLP